MSDSGKSEMRKRLVVGIGFGMVAGLAAVVFSNSVAFGVLFGCLMSVPAIISSRSPIRDQPALPEVKNSAARAPRRRLSHTTKAMLAGLVFAGLRVTGELNQARARVRGGPCIDHSGDLRSHLLDSVVCKRPAQGRA